MLHPSRYAPGTPRFEPRVDAELTPIPPQNSHEQQPAVEAQASGQDRSAQPPARAQTQGGIEQDDARTGLLALPLVRAASSSRVQLDPNGLAGRHIQVLVDYWTCNARVADLCRQHSVAMLDCAHSAAYIQQQLSFLRVYANAWIGKPGMVHPLADYVDDPPRFTRSYAATKDRSWDGNEVEFKSIVEKIGAIDPRVAAQLALLLAFGLRRKEALMFMPHVAVLRRENVPTSQHPSDRYAVFLKVEGGTKGGRLRFVAIRNDQQRAALDRALPFAPHPSSHLGHPGLTLKQSLKRFDNVMRKAGVTKKELGVTAHSLRHQFAQEFHVELTDVQAPVRGGDECADPAILNAALLEIARQLGHNRTAITTAYLGSPAQPHKGGAHDPTA